MPAETFVLLDTQSSRLICRGDWNIENLVKIKKELKKVTWPKQGELTVDGQAVTKMDTAGAWQLNDLIKKISSSNLKAQLGQFSEQAQELLALVASNTSEESK